jgi:hypothetical protein
MKKKAGSNPTHMTGRLAHTLVVISLSVLYFGHCATNWKVTGSIPDGVIGNFH